MKIQKHPFKCNIPSYCIIIRSMKQARLVDFPFFKALNETFFLIYYLSIFSFVCILFCFPQTSASHFTLRFQVFVVVGVTFK